MEAQGSDEYLGRLLEFWQPRLKLADWTINATYDHTIARGDILGCCDITGARGIANIKIVPGKTAVAVFEEGDEEHSFVHEMLHLHFHDFRPEQGTLEYEKWELAIDRIATALVNLRRDRYNLSDLI